MSEENSAANESSANSLDLSTFFGIKAGMTRVFDNDGNHIPVTVIKLIPNYISQVKTAEKDGYESYQLSYGEKREKLVNKPKLGHLKKAQIDKALSRASEVFESNVDVANLGKVTTLGKFQASTFVDVTATSKGKGFQGVMKRHNFAGGPAAHGSHFHRTGGSIGNRATPGRVFKGKKMPGHMGSKQVTLQNLAVFEVNEEKGYMLIKGSVPGAKNTFVRVSKAVKK